MAFKLVLNNSVHSLLSIKHFNKQAKSTLLKKAVGPEDICDTVDFFINNNSITGQVIAVDSGQNLNWNIKNEKE